MFAQLAPSETLWFCFLKQTVLRAGRTFHDVLKHSGRCRNSICLLIIICPATSWLATSNHIQTRFKWPLSTDSTSSWCRSVFNIVILLSSVFMCCMVLCIWCWVFKCWTDQLSSWILVAASFRAASFFAKLLWRKWQLPWIQVLQFYRPKLNTSHTVHIGTKDLSWRGFHKTWCLGVWVIKEEELEPHPDSDCNLRATCSAILFCLITGTGPDTPFWLLQIWLSFLSHRVTVKEAQWSCFFIRFYCSICSRSRTLFKSQQITDEVWFMSLFYKRRVRLTVSSLFLKQSAEMNSLRTRRLHVCYLLPGGSGVLWFTSDLHQQVRQLSSFQVNNWWKKLAKYLYFSTVLEQNLPTGYKAVQMTST